MSTNQFIPKFKNTEVASEETLTFVNETGSVHQWFVRLSQYLVIALFGLIPIFFTPKLWATLGFDKVLIAVLVVALVASVLSFLALRKTQVHTVLPVTLGLFWLFLLAAIISGLVSTNVQEAFRGSFLEVQTVGFLAVLAFVMTLPLILQGSKKLTIKALVFFTITSSILLVYNALRLLTGLDFLSFGTFAASTMSPLGSFNDLAIFSALIVILGLISLAQLPLNRGLKITVAGLIVLSLALLSVINFFNVWLIVGFFSLLLFVYLLSRDAVFSQRVQSRSPLERSRTVLVVAVVVLVTSGLFVVAGDSLGVKLSEMTGISYVEVRPSFTATVDIVKSVYRDDILFGAGPNHFADAWRLYKDKSINETIFWETEFTAGNSFVSTVFVNLGLVGGIMLVFFHLWFLYLGYKILIRNAQADSYWYFFGLSSFTAASFLWGMSYLYVPGTAIMLLAAVFTGFTFVASGALVPKMLKNIPLAVSPQRGFFLMAGAILVVSVATASLYTVTKQYLAQKQFVQAQVLADSTEEFSERAREAYQMYPDARFLGAVARVKLEELNALLEVGDPTEEQQQQFLKVAEEALIVIEQAIRTNQTNPFFHTILAGIYANLAVASVDGALERADRSLTEAKRHDPHNPGYHLIAAHIATRAEDVDRARREISSALELKRNYTEALYLSSQLDIREGNTEGAIATTRSIITLEPQNQTRYFQLGVLFTAANRLDEAVNAFRSAISLYPQYANARYLLALIYLERGQTEEALQQLREVQMVNKDNQELAMLISQIESGEYEIPENIGLDTPVQEAGPIEGQDGVMLDPQSVGSGLINPVNTVPSLQREASPQTDDEEVQTQLQDDDDTLEIDATVEDETTTAQ